MGRSETGITPDAVEALVRYPWPGNIRELRNVLERAVLLAEGDTLRALDLQFDKTLSGAVGMEGPGVCRPDPASLPVKASVRRPSAPGG